MKTFGEQKHCALDRIKPYQRPKLSDPAHEGVRLQPGPDGRVRCWRPKARLGTPKAITAMAHKLARILWHLFKYREAFNPEVFRREEEKMKRKKLARLHNTAAALGLKLVAVQ